MDTFRRGQIVQIIPTHHWAKDAIGTVAEPPSAVRKVTGDWQGCMRMVKTLKGTIPFYWVNFAEAQIDADGDGPYAGGEIDARYLARGLTRAVANATHCLRARFPVGGSPTSSFRRGSAKLVLKQAKIGV
jgi:hypothetical protein